MLDIAIWRSFDQQARNKMGLYYCFNWNATRPIWILPKCKIWDRLVPATFQSMLQYHHLQYKWNLRVNRDFQIVGGITGGFLYVGETTAMLSYPHQNDRGFYLGNLSYTTLFFSDND